MATKRQFLRFDFKPDRFKELIVYVASQLQDDPTFGSVKLNKILYYADFASYRMFGEPISGATYHKLSEGPVPIQMLETRSEMLAEGEIQLEDRPHFTGSQQRLVLCSGRQPNPEAFDPEERHLLDEIIDFFRGKTAREVSDYSQREPGWVVADDRGVIPYETAWLSGEPIEQGLIEAGLRWAKEHR